MNESEKREIEEDFWKFMRNSIWYCARNVTRSASAAEIRNGGISLETLNEGSLGECVMVEDGYEAEDEIAIVIRNIRFTLHDAELNGAFEGLTEREKQALILHEGFGLSYDAISKFLDITPERARDYKYHGLKKARAKGNGKRKDPD